MTGTSTMATIRQKYLSKDRDRHGNVRWYCRRRGKPKIRVEGEPGTEAFHKAFGAALKQLSGEAIAAQAEPKKLTRGAPGSFRWLCEQYYRSAAFRHDLDVSTQRVRRNILEAVCVEPQHSGSGAVIGDLPFAIPEDKVIVLRDRKADRIDSANGRLKALRMLFEFAVSDPTIRIKRNPAKAVPYLRSRKKGGFHAWSLAEVEQFLNFHPAGSKPRLALVLILLTGQRRSDIVLFGKQHLREARLMPEQLRRQHEGRWIHFTQFKGRQRYPTTLTLPVLPELEQAIATSTCGDMTFLATKDGKGYSAAGFGNWFRRQCNAAGLPHCSAHGLRKAGATIAADNGATAHQLKALFGWRTLKQAEVYTQQADQKRLAGTAARLLLPGKSGNECVPLLPTVSESGTQRGRIA